MECKWDIHVPQISRMNTDFFDLLGLEKVPQISQIYTDFFAAYAAGVMNPIYL